MTPNQAYFCVCVGVQVASSKRLASLKYGVLEAIKSYFKMHLQSLLPIDIIKRKIIYK